MNAFTRMTFTPSFSIPIHRFISNVYFNSCNWMHMRKFAFSITTIATREKKNTTKTTTTENSSWLALLAVFPRSKISYCRQFRCFLRPLFEFNEFTSNWKNYYEKPLNWLKGTYFYPKTFIQFHNCQIIQMANGMIDSLK